MRKLRARRKRQPYGANGLPCFTWIDGRRLRRYLQCFGFHPPIAFLPAAVNALNLLCGRSPDPYRQLRQALRGWALGHNHRGRPGPRQAPDAIDFLNRYIARTLGLTWTPELTLPADVERIMAPSRSEPRFVRTSHPLRSGWTDES